MNVAFQGEQGAYSEAAIIQRWGGAAKPIPKPVLEDVFDSVERGEAEFALVPIENSIEGTITRTLDLLYERRLSIVGEEILRVILCLVVNFDVDMSAVKRVYSHPQALSQARGYLRAHNLEPINFYDTAGSAKMIRDQGLKDAAAIASRHSAEVYGLKVLSEGIEMSSENYTRFLCVGNCVQPPTGRDKTSLVFIVNHRPGALIDALRTFAEKGINLMKIESRPLHGKPWEYAFFIDFEGHRDELIPSEALRDLTAMVNSLKILGSYPRA
jgi:chorismate mutase / prephenate dehydratase